MAEQESLIDLSTEVKPRRFITIDGSRYELRSLDEFSVSEQHALSAKGRQFSRFNTELSEKDEEPTTDEGKEIEDSLADLVNSFVIDGSEAIGKLTDTQKLEVMKVFFPKADSETGISPTPSPASNGSTEAPSATG